MMKRKVSVVVPFCIVLLMLIVPSVHAEEKHDADMWSFTGTDDNWKYNDDGSITHSPQGRAIDFLLPIDFSKSFKLSLDFSYDKAECLAAGGERASFNFTLRTRNAEVENILGSNVIGPHLPTEGDNTWLAEPAFNNGKAWLNCNIERAWVPVPTNDFTAHVVVERMAGEKIINMEVTVGETVIIKGNMYLSKMADFLAQKDLILGFAGNDLATAKFTFQNIEIINDGETLYSGVSAKTTTSSAAPATTSSASTDSGLTTTSAPDASLSNPAAVSTAITVSTSTEGDGNSYWGWIITAALVVIAAGIVVTSLILRKKKMN